MKSHPALSKVITGLVVVLLAGTYLVIANYQGWWPYASTQEPQGQTAGPGEHCGGNVADPLQCQDGYHCAPTPGSHLPYGDVGGTCVSDNSPAPSVSYRNTQYGFEIPLPASWHGYTVATKNWDGTIYDAKGNQTATDRGPEIVVLYPGASIENPHEGMPVMVFTLKQWELVSAGETNPQKPFMSVGAAPFGPSELGRNSQYVLALPARYNYDYSPGWEEVDQLVHLLTAFEPGATASCIPRPACLDATPRCLPPEPAEGWCPTY